MMTAALLAACTPLNEPDAIPPSATWTGPSGGDACGSVAVTDVDLADAPILVGCGVNHGDGVAWRTYRVGADTPSGPLADVAPVRTVHAGESAASFGDVDGDGDADVVMSGRYTSIFDPGVTGELDDDYHSVHPMEAWAWCGGDACPGWLRAVPDLDGDGTDDLVGLSDGYADLAVVLFGPPASDLGWDAAVRIPPAGKVWTPPVSDDGYLYAVVGEADPFDIVRIPVRAGGDLVPDARWTTTSQFVTVGGDLDGNGVRDFYTRGWVVPDPDGGDVTDGYAIDEVETRCCSTGEESAIGDVDGDGAADLIVELKGERVGIFLGPITASSPEPALVLVGEPDTAFGGHVAVGDVDGDGQDDVVVGAHTTGPRKGGAVHLWRGSDLFPSP